MKLRTSMAPYPPRTAATTADNRLLRTATDTFSPTLQEGSRSRTKRMQEEPKQGVNQSFQNFQKEHYEWRTNLKGLAIPSDEGKAPAPSIGEVIKDVLLTFLFGGPEVKIGRTGEFFRPSSTEIGMVEIPARPSSAPEVNEPLLPNAGSRQPAGPERDASPLAGSAIAEPVPGKGSPDAEKDSDSVPADSPWHRYVTPINLEGRIPLAEGTGKGTYSIDGKTYIALDGGTYEVTYDNPLRSWKIINPNHPQAFYGSQPVRLNERGGWEAFSGPGLRGGGPGESQSAGTGASPTSSARDSASIVQNLFGMDENAAKSFLHAYRFQKNGPYSEQNFAVEMEQTLTIPKWAGRFKIPKPSSPEQPQSPLSPLSPKRTPSPTGSDASSSRDNGTSADEYANSPVTDEVRPLRNNYKEVVKMPPGGYFNRLGLIERTDIPKLYRVESSERVARRGDPSNDGFRTSVWFGGTKKMLDGDVVITSGSREGAESYGNGEFGAGKYHLYEINSSGLKAVSLRENFEYNARFTAMRSGYDADYIAHLRAQGRMNELDEGAYEFDEVHVAEEGLTPDLIKKLH